MFLASFFARIPIIQILAYGLYYSESCKPRYCASSNTLTHIMQKVSPMWINELLPANLTDTICINSQVSSVKDLKKVGNTAQPSTESDQVAEARSWKIVGKTKVQSSTSPNQGEKSKKKRNQNQSAGLTTKKL